MLTEGSRSLVRESPSSPRAAGSLSGVAIWAEKARNQRIADPRFSTSDALLGHASERARELGADTQLINLRSLDFKHCEGNYSKASELQYSQVPAIEP